MVAGIESMTDPIKVVTDSFTEFCERPDPTYDQRGDMFRCPCCDCFTLNGVAQYDICPVCFWEDDGTTSEHGFSPNGCSLGEARQNYLKFGANQERDLQHVREPLPNEQP